MCVAALNSQISRPHSPGDDDDSEGHDVVGDFESHDDAGDYNKDDDDEVLRLAKNINRNVLFQKPHILLPS